MTSTPGPLIAFESAWITDPPKPKAPGPGRMDAEQRSAPLLSSVGVPMDAPTASDATGRGAELLDHVFGSECLQHGRCAKSN